MKPESPISRGRTIILKLLLATVAVSVTDQSQARTVSNATPNAVIEGVVRAMPYPQKSGLPIAGDRSPSPFAEIIARGTTATFVKPEIRVDGDGAVADYGLQKVYFPADITEAPITIITPDGRRLRCRATFLALLDVATGRSVLLGQVTRSEGRLVGDNAVIYPNAFDSISADIRYRYTKYSLEQDIILHENPQIPAGFESGNVRLEVWSEWIDSTPDSKETQTIDLRPMEASAKQFAVASSDEQLKFGATRIADGFAFSLGNEADKTPVAKQFMRVEGRDWLIERVDYAALKSKLDLLPKTQAGMSPDRIKTGRTGLVKSLQAKVSLNAGNKIRRMALAYPASRDSVVLDFVIVSSVPNPADVISWWPAGGNANDVISSNHGTLHNTATYGIGKVGQGFVFDGFYTDDYMEIPDSPSLNPTNGLTVEAWIYFGDDQSYWNMPIVSKDGMSARQYLLTKSEGDVIRAHVGVTNGNFYYFDGQITLQPFNWYHVAMTYSVAQSNLSIYVNGVLDSSALVSGSLITSDELLYIGGSAPWYYFWGGKIDEPAIYSRALSPSEIQSIYNAGAAGKINPNCVSAATNIVAWWSGDGNVYDLARTNHVTLSNGATLEPGIVSDGFSFDGSSSHARLADRPALRFTNTLTIEAWVNPTDTSWYGQIVDKWDAVVGVNQRSYTTGLLPGGQFFFLVDPTGNGSGSTYVATTNAVEVGGWSHVAGTYDGNKLRVYLNGLLEAEAVYTNGIYSGTNDMAIGAVVGGMSAGAAISLFPGMIDEPTIYNRALTNSEITAIFTAGGAGKCKVDTDGDGLTDLQESFLATNPNDTDSEDDGLTDGDEVFVHKTNPNAADTDGDGVSDGIEINQGRNPLVGAVSDSGNQIQFKVYTPLK